MIELDKIYNEDCLTGLKRIDDNSIDCCVTSPPYFALRDYGCEGQIGLEHSPEEYIDKLTAIFAEVLRAMKPEGTCWVVIGDSYAGANKGAARYPENAKLWLQGTNRGTLDRATSYKYVTEAKDRDLIGIPWMLAFSLRRIGFYLRQDIIWHKPNPWPGKGWTHRLCCTGKTLEEELGEEPDWATAPRLDFWNDRHKRPKRHGFTSLLRAMHNLRFIFAARVNGRWAIIGDEWFGGQFLSCGYHDEKGEIQRSGCAYSWEFTVEPLPHPICYYNGEIGIRKEDGE